MIDKCKELKKLMPGKCPDVVCGNDRHLWAYPKDLE